MVETRGRWPVPGRECHDHLGHRARYIVDLRPNSGKRSRWRRGGRREKERERDRAIRATLTRHPRPDRADSPIRRGCQSESRESVTALCARLFSFLLRPCARSRITASADKGSRSGGSGEKAQFLSEGEERAFIALRCSIASSRACFFAKSDLRSGGFLPALPSVAVAIATSIVPSSPSAAERKRSLTMRPGLRDVSRGPEDRGKKAARKRRLNGAANCTRG